MFAASLSQADPRRIFRLWYDAGAALNRAYVQCRPPGFGGEVARDYWLIKRNSNA